MFLRLSYQKKILKSMHHTNDSGPGPRQPLLPQRWTMLIHYAAVQKQMKIYNIFFHKLHTRQSLTLNNQQNLCKQCSHKQKMAYTGMYFAICFQTNWIDKFFRQFKPKEIQAGMKNKTSMVCHMLVALSLIQLPRSIIEMKKQPGHDLHVISYLRYQVLK